jgi:hypothetical protein
LAIVQFRVATNASSRFEVRPSAARSLLPRTAPDITTGAGRKILEDHMQKLMLGFLVAIIALAPAIAAAQSGGGSGSGSGGASSGAGSSPGASGSGSGSGAGGSGTSGTAGGATTGSPSGGAGGSSTSPSASPGTAGDFSKITTKVDCDKAGGSWQMASNKCEAKVKK